MNTAPIIRAALQVAKEREATLDRLRDALAGYESGDADALPIVIECARELCGMDDEKGDRPAPRLV